jgi:hypothetical protein
MILRRDSIMRPYIETLGALLGSNDKDNIINAYAYPFGYLQPLGIL